MQAKIFHKAPEKKTKKNIFFWKRYHADSWPRSLAIPAMMVWKSVMAALEIAHTLLKT